MRQLIVLESTDLALLYKGGTLSLGSGSAAVDLILDRGVRRSSANGHADARPEQFNKMRADCPECGKADVQIVAHWKRAHSDKPMPYFGPPGTGVKCPYCELTLPSERSLRVHSNNVHAKEARAARAAAKKKGGK